MLNQKDRVSVAVQILVDAAEEIASVLIHEEDVHVLQNMKNGLRNLVNRTGIIAGLPHAGAISITQEYKPITNFLGDEIITRQAVTAADIDPTEAEIRNYHNRVDDLYANIAGLKPEKVLTDYTANENEKVVLRGVAAKANVPDYETAPINELFIEAIIKGIDDNNKRDALQQNEENALQQSLADKQRPPEDVILTDAHLTAFPELVTMGLTAGDTITMEKLNEISEKQSQRPTAPAPATAPVTAANQEAVNTPAAATNKRTNKAATDTNDNKQ